MSQSVKVGSVSLPDPARAPWLGRTLLLALSLPSLAASAQPARAELEPPPAGAVAPDPAAREWCALPLCRDAEGLRQAGDLQGALKLYRYIQEEVDVDEKVLRKPLLWFVIASLHKELQQPQQGLEALARYQQYIAARPDTEEAAAYQRIATRLREKLAERQLGGCALAAGSGRRCQRTSQRRGGQ